MKFIRPNENPRPAQSDGGSPMLSWRRKWLAEKVQKVQLECGCIEDLSIPAITFIDTFDGTSIDCVNHLRFARVVRKIKPPKTQYPADPLF